MAFVLAFAPAGRVSLLRYALDIKAAFDQIDGGVGNITSSVMSG